MSCLEIAGGSDSIHAYLRLSYIPILKDYIISVRHDCDQQEGHEYTITVSLTFQLDLYLKKYLFPLSLLPYLILQVQHAYAYLRSFMSDCWSGFTKARDALSPLKRMLIFEKLQELSCIYFSPFFSSSSLHCWKLVLCDSTTIFISLRFQIITNTSSLLNSELYYLRVTKVIQDSEVQELFVNLKVENLPFLLIIFLYMFLNQCLFLFLLASLNDWLNFHSLILPNWKKVKILV